MRFTAKDANDQIQKTKNSIKRYQRKQAEVDVVAEQEVEPAEHETPKGHCSVRSVDNNNKTASFWQKVMASCIKNQQRTERDQLKENVYKQMLLLPMGMDESLPFPLVPHLEINCLEKLRRFSRELLRVQFKPSCAYLIRPPICNLCVRLSRNTFNLSVRAIDIGAGRTAFAHFLV